MIPKKIISQQVRSIDILPTLLDIFHIDIAKNEEISGKTMIPIIEGKNDERVAIIESGNPLKTGKPPKESNVVAIRMNNWNNISYNSLVNLINPKKD